MNVKNVCLNDLNQLKHPMCIDSEAPLDFLIKKVARLGGILFLGFASFYEFAYLCLMVNRRGVGGLHPLDVQVFFVVNSLLAYLSFYFLKN